MLPLLLPLLFQLLVLPFAAAGGDYGVCPNAVTVTVTVTVPPPLTTISHCPTCPLIVVTESAQVITSCNSPTLSSTTTVCSTQGVFSCGGSTHTCFQPPCTTGYQAPCSTCYACPYNECWAPGPELAAVAKYVKVYEYFDNQLLDFCDELWQYEVLQSSSLEPDVRLNASREPVYMKHFISPTISLFTCLRLPLSLSPRPPQLPRRLLYLLSSLITIHQRLISRRLLVNLPDLALFHNHQHLSPLLHHPQLSPVSASSLEEAQVSMASMSTKSDLYLDTRIHMVPFSTSSVPDYTISSTM